MPKQRQRNKQLEAARVVARAAVAQQCPDLANVEPTVTERTQRQHLTGCATASAAPKPSALVATPVPSATEYTFTFVDEVQTPEGYTMPRIARITVDSLQRIIKTVMSK